MRSNLLVLTLAALFVGALPATAPATNLVHSLEEAQALAAEKDIPIVVDFFAVWCGPCKRFNKAVEEDATLQKALDQVVLFKTDAEKEGKELAEKHSIKGFPTYVVMTPQGEVINRWWGFGGSEHFIEALDETLADPVTVAQRKARYEEAPTAKDAEVLARVSNTRGENVDAVAYYREIQRLDPDQADAQLTPIFHAMSDGYRGEEFTLDEVKKAADAVMAAENMEPSTIFDVASVMNYIAKKAKDPEMAAPYLKAAITRSEGVEDEEISERRKYMLVDYAMVVEKDPDKALALKKETLAEDWDQNSGAMNAFAWWCYENNVNLEEAEAIARKAVELAETDEDKANILDTVAQICNARGDCRDAVTLIEQALVYNPESEYLQKQLDKFQKILAAAE